MNGGNRAVQLSGVSIGVVMTGSHCTVGAVLPALKRLKSEGALITVIFSYTVNFTDNRFHTVDELKKEIATITDKPIITTITDAEPIGPNKLFDVLVVAPCTGNTLAKMANAITDTPALMAIKAQLRNQRPVIIALSTNDGLGCNARNLGYLLNAKNVYFVPFRQDDPYNKSTSLVADMDRLFDTVVYALKGKQLQPLLLGPLGEAG
ncbi:MAG: dipicolinate synthase subunit B [Syntrophomonadaceae bacterium]|nr:dipicolinate synthase subunit B [Syntrophomonadaceae bacterium]